MPRPGPALGTHRKDSLMPLVGVGAALLQGSESLMGGAAHGQAGDFGETRVLFLLRNLVQGLHSPEPRRWAHSPLSLLSRVLSGWWIFQVLYSSFISFSSLITASLYFISLYLLKRYSRAEKGGKEEVLVSISSWLEKARWSSWRF